MKKILTFCVTALLLNTANAQNIGINNSDPKAALDLNGGFRLRPENTTVTSTSVMLTSNRSHHVLIGSPVADFNIAFTGATENGQHAIITNTTLRKGFLIPIYIQPNSTVEVIYSNGAWKLIGTNEPASSTAWGLTGNAGTDTSVNFIGTTDNKPLRFKANSLPAGILDAYYLNTAFGPNAYSKFNGNFSAVANVAIGAGALANDTIGNGNTAVGYESMDETRSAGLQNTAVGGSSLRFNTGSRNSAFGGSTLGFIRTGNYNTALGAASMGYRLNGDLNTAVGLSSLGSNNGNENVVVGANAMLEDQIGDRNTAIGSSAMERSRQSKGSVAVGYRALYSDTAAEGIIAIGRAALYSGIRRQGNIAIGDSAMFSNGINAASNADGSTSIAIGSHALFTNQTGYSNTSIGYYSMYSNQTGTANTVIGGRALAFNVSGGSNTVVGETALYNNSNGFQNTALGTQSLYQNIAGNQNVAVGGNSLYNNKNGNGAVAIGSSAVFTDTAANGIVAIGRAALYKNYNNPGNLAIGDSALFNNSSKDLGIHPTWSINNVAIGNKAMYRNATGSSNTAIGVNAMTTNYNGNNNTAIGFESFKNATAASSNNIAIGSRAMSEAIEVTSNIAIGTHTLNRTGRSGNIAIGDSSLANYVGFVFDGNISGNVALGYQALKSVTIGNHNTGIGSFAGEKNFNGIGNVYVGYQAGFNNSQGGANVFLGNQAGYNAHGGNKLYIENTTADSLNSLIYGDFTADSLLLNAKTVVRNNAVVKGYTKLGGYDTDVPSIKMKKINIPAGPAVNAVQSYPLGSGITDAKVVGIQVLMNYAGSWKIPPSYIDAAGYEYNVQVQNNNIVIVLKTGNSANIGGKPISVIVTYEE